MPTSFVKYLFYALVFSAFVVMMSYSRLVASDNIDSATLTDPISDIVSIGSLRAEVDEFGNFTLPIETLDVDEVARKLPMKIAETQKANGHDIHVTYVFVDDNKQAVNADNPKERYKIRGVQYKINYMNRGNEIYEADGEVKNTMEVLTKQDILKP